MQIHEEAAEISYKHGYDIHQALSKTINYDSIRHFSLNLVRPDGEMLFLSGTPSHAYEICSKGLDDFDGIISEDNYKKYEFYWWKDAAHKANANDIEYIRNVILGLHNGFMLVRKFDDFYLLYSFAFKKDIHETTSLVINNINNFLRMGDDAYMLLRNKYKQYCGIYTPPIINSFFPFEGGQPKNRKTIDKNNNDKSNIILFPQKHIIG